MGLAITIGVFSIIAGLSIFFKSRKFRETRERVLIHSSEFQKLLKLGFKTKIIDNKTIYVGEYKKFHFAIFIDSDDVMANSDFSIVFSVSYVKLDDETFKKLNKEYYNRLKFLLMRSENLFFHKNFAQFRYSNNVLKVKENKIFSKLEWITEVLDREKLEPREITDFRIAISKDYE